MRKIPILLNSICLLLFFWTYTNVYAANECVNGTQNTAFPEAQGEGKCSVGWRGGTIYVIDTLSDDTNDGTTLRDCLESSGARVCVFAVGGVINLTGAINITNSNVYVVGQTAPGGVQVKVSPVSWVTCNQDALIELCADCASPVSGVFIRGLRLRAGIDQIGIGKCSSMDSINVLMANTFMLAQLSLEFGTDGNVDFSDQGGSSLGTLQQSIISEPLTCAGIPGEACEATNTIGDFAGGANGGPVTFWKNLWSEAHHRVMQEQFDGKAWWANNVIIGGGNSKHVLAYASNHGQQMKNNYSGNWIKPDDFSAAISLTEVFLTRNDGAGSSSGSSIWIDPDYPHYYCNSPTNGCIGTPDCSNGCTTAIFTSNPLGTPISTAQVDKHSYTQPDLVSAPQACLDVIGPNNITGAVRYINKYGKWVDNRDYLDQRIMDATGGCDYDELASSPLGSPNFQLDKPTSHPDVAANPSHYDNDGYPILPTVLAYTDSDSDGMSDTWEALECPGGDCSPWGDDALLRCPNSANNGWSNAEEFWNGTCPYNKRKKTGFILQ